MGQLVALLTENWLLITGAIIGSIILLELFAELLGPPQP